MGAGVLAGLSAVWGQAAGGGDKPKPPAPGNPGRWKLYGFLEQDPQTRPVIVLKPRLREAFAFTEEQITQFAQAVDAANPEGARQEFRQQMQNPQLAPQERAKLQADHNAKMKSLTEDLRAKLDSILTPEQKTLMQKIVEGAKVLDKALEDYLDKSLTPEEKSRVNRNEAARGPAKAG